MGVTHSTKYGESVESVEFRFSPQAHPAKMSREAADHSISPNSAHAQLAADWPGLPGAGCSPVSKRKAHMVMDGDRQWSLLIC
jgi:hypothetical protein